MLEESKVEAVPKDVHRNNSLLSLVAVEVAEDSGGVGSRPRVPRSRPRSKGSL